MVQVRHAKCHLTTYRETLSPLAPLELLLLLLASHQCVACGENDNRRVEKSRGFTFAAFGNEVFGPIVESVESFASEFIIAGLISAVVDKLRAIGCVELAERIELGAVLFGCFAGFLFEA